ncbi:hypothetical protein FI615_002071 [Enterococcus faecium]|nr:hypothetical protein [Enterococcus faecium]
MSQTKLEKLRIKLADNKKKRDALNESIKKIQQQIIEEETKEFRSVVDEMDLTVEEAVQLLRERKKYSLDTPTPLPNNRIVSNQNMKENIYGNI